jgi:xanthine dehydrogenase large subunit
MNAPEKFLAAPTARPAMGSSHFHESARAQVAGGATYIDDVPEVKGTLHAAPILSSVAHGHLRGVDAAEALAMPGVKGVVLAKDIPGDPLLATFVHDEPVFAIDKVEHIGQVVGLVVADTVMQARRAARKVKLDIEPLPAVVGGRRARGSEGAELRAATGDRAPR